jgi:hypothetical protein
VVTEKDEYDGFGFAEFPTSLVGSEAYLQQWSGVD